MEAIKNMPTPECKKDMERFLGIVTYLRKFIPNLSDHTALLRELTQDDVVWH